MEFIDGRCPPIPTVANSTADSNNASQGSVIEVTCNHGYGIGGVPASQTITCTTNLTWDIQLQPCQCKEFMKPETFMPLSTLISKPKRRLKNRRFVKYLFIKPFVFIPEKLCP